MAKVQITVNGYTRKYTQFACAAQRENVGIFLLSCAAPLTNQETRL